MHTPLPMIRLVLLFLVLGLSGAHAQDGPQPIPAQRAKALIEQRLAAMRERVERLEALQARLDRGESLNLQDFEGLLDRMEERPRQMPGGPAPQRGDRRGNDDQPGLAGGPRGGPGTPWRGEGIELDDERRARVLAFLEEHSPEAHRRLMQSDPAVAERLLTRTLGPRVLRVLDAQDADPQRGALALEEYLAGAALLDAGMRLRQSYMESGESSTEFAEARDAFQQALAREMDARLALRMQEFAQLEHRLGLQRQTLNQEREQRAQRIEEAMQQTLERLRRSREMRRERGGDD